MPGGLLKNEPRKGQAGLIHANTSLWQWVFFMRLKHPVPHAWYPWWFSAHTLHTTDMAQACIDGHMIKPVFL